MKSALTIILAFCILLTACGKVQDPAEDTKTESRGETLGDFHETEAETGTEFPEESQTETVEQTEEETKENPRDLMLILSDEMKAEIEAAYLREYGWETGWYEEGGSNRYYGTYHDAVVFEYDTDVPALNLVVIEGIELPGNTHAYIDGRFYKLTEAYDIGVLTLEDLQDLREYATWFAYNQDELKPPLPPHINENADFPEPLSDELKEEIAKVWYNWFASNGSTFKWYDYENGTYGQFQSNDRYYGTYHDAVIIFRSYRGDSKTLTVADVTIESKWWFEVWVYQFRKWYTLQEAYDTGILTKADIQRIADFHNSLDPNGNNWKE